MAIPRLRAPTSSPGSLHTDRQQTYEGARDGAHGCVVLRCQEQTDARVHLDHHHEQETQQDPEGPHGQVIVAAGPGRSAERACDVEQAEGSDDRCRIPMLVSGISEINDRTSGVINAVNALEARTCWINNALFPTTRSGATDTATNSSPTRAPEEPATPREKS